MNITDLKILIIGDHYWGKGDTIADALKAYRKAGGSTKQYLVYICHPDTYVDDMGYICTPANADGEAGCYRVKEIDRHGVKKVGCT